MASISALGLREVRRERGGRPADRDAELEMLHSYRERLLNELAEVDRELQAASHAR